MNNFIEYFYNIKIDKVIYNHKYYSFIYNGYTYKLYIYDNYNNINMLMELNNKLIGVTLLSEIIYNINNEIISVYNGVSYILLKLYVNTNKQISLNEIAFLSNTLYKEKLNVNWGFLWGRKIDYLEDLINENGKKYPLIVDSFNYFVGMAENAISYYNDIFIDKDYKYSVCHKIIRVNDTIEALYNPLNITFDYRVRDVAEYIKNAFFNNNKYILNELDNYLKTNTLSLMEAKLLVARLLYPSFYFDMYEDILIDNQEEKIILDIISKLDDYEIYLSQIISYLKQSYDIDEIRWLKKQ